MATQSLPKPEKSRIEKEGAGRRCLMSERSLGTPVDVAYIDRFNEAFAQLNSLRMVLNEAMPDSIVADINCLMSPIHAEFVELHKELRDRHEKARALGRGEA